MKRCNHYVFGFLLTIQISKDCNWGDHCGQIQREFGVTAQRTPRGLTWNDFTVAMQTFRRVWEDE